MIMQAKSQNTSHTQSAADCLVLYVR